MVDDSKTEDILLERCHWLLCLECLGSHETRCPSFWKKRILSFKTSKFEIDNPRLSFELLCGCDDIIWRYGPMNYPQVMDLTQTNNQGEDQLFSGCLSHWLTLPL